MNGADCATSKEARRRNKGAYPEKGNENLINLIDCSSKGGDGSKTVFVKQRSCGCKGDGLASYGHAAASGG